ncbi:MAG: NlpC/P60 family protein [Pseudomonadota bacterium]
MTHDPRTTLARPDLAAEDLKGTVEAERFVPGHMFRVSSDRTALRRGPDASQGMDTVLLHGERFRVLEIAEGWAWGQAELDGYVGYVTKSHLTNADGYLPTHRVTSRTAQIYRTPELKVPPVHFLPFGAQVQVTDTQDRYSAIAPNQWIPTPLLSPLEKPAPDWVAVAESFVGAPYVWGGRSSLGLDCSALVQLSLQAAGQSCPRDSDMQEAQLGETLKKDVPAQRGDVVFWKGHVGIMLTKTRLLHANAHHMCVAAEPLNAAVKRIDAAGDGPVTRRARLDVAAAK